MAQENPKSYGYSSNLEAHLCVNGYVMPIAQLGPNFVVLKNPTDHPPVDAEIVMSIDGDESRWRVHLAHGIQSALRKTSISACTGET